MPEVTLKLIKKLLCHVYPNVEITDFNECAGSKRGDNYTSMVFRIYLHGTKKSKSDQGVCIEPWEHALIYKCLPENQERREAFKSDSLFRNEVAFYTKIWPTLLRFQKNRNVPVFDCIPTCFLPQDDLIILDDLCNYGFHVLERKKVLDINHCYAILKTLAYFHALSFAMKYQCPDEFFEVLNSKDSVSEAYFQEDYSDWFHDYYNQAADNATRMIEIQLEHNNDKEIYMRKFKEFTSKNVYLMMVELVSPKEPLSVITHGDCWANNVFFKYDEEGAIKEVKLIDFQLVRYASPALDLAYLLYLCLSRQHRDEYLPELIDFYLDHLHQKTVELTDPGSVFHTKLDRKKLGELFGADFRRCAQYGLGLALDMIPIITCDPDEAPNLYQGSDSSSSSSSNMPVWTSNEECRRRLTDLLCELVDQDLL